MSAALDGWGDLVAAMGRVGATIDGLGADATDVDRAEGHRFVLQVLGDQVERATMRASARPAFLPGVGPTRKLFFDNPDTDYDTAQVSGRRRYRITGQRGTVPYLAFCVYAGNMARGEPTRVANIADTDLTFDADGRFTLTLAPEGDATGDDDVIQLDPGAHTVIARQYHLDREREVPATYAIEALDVTEPDAHLDGARLSKLAGGAASFLTAAVDLAVARTVAAQERPNTFVAHEGHGVFGTPDAHYLVCWYDLADGESLVIEGRPPACRYWGVHLSNRWGQSLDHRSRSTVRNASSVVLEDDGSFRIVVAAADPGEPNWLDASGHPRGFALFRWLLADTTTAPPTATVVSAPPRT